MNLSFRNNCSLHNFGNDYVNIRNFLLKSENPHYSYGRWDWMMTHNHADQNLTPKIGVWEDNGEIVALVTHDGGPGECYFHVQKNFEFLLKDMLLYAKDSFSNNGQSKILICDSDAYFQDIAAAAGYTAIADGENDAVFPITKASLDYDLPDGFSITSMADHCDYYQYKRVLWKGFNHETEGGETFHPSQNDLLEEAQKMNGPNVNLDLKIAITSPNGEYVSYCGMWYDPASNYAIVEPVATIPEYRQLGLGKAAVLEGIKRCGLLGAKKAFVGSNQQFYYSIGFRPCLSFSWWIKNT